MPLRRIRAPRGFVRRWVDREDGMTRWPRRRRSLIGVVVLGAVVVALLAVLFLTVLSLRNSDPNTVSGPPWLSWVGGDCEYAPFSCALVAGALVAQQPIVIGLLGLV